MTTISDDGTFTRLVNAGLDYQLANFDRTQYIVGNFVWDLPKASKLMGGNKAAGLFLDHWVFSGVTTLASGMPMDVGMTISGVDAGQRLLGTITSGNLSGQQMRFLLNGSPQTGSTINASALVVPQLGNIGPYPRTYLRNSWIVNQDLSLFKNIPFSADGKRYIQLRLEAFNAPNHPQISGYNLTTNVTNGANATGNNIFSNFSGLVATTNFRPAGNTSVLGTTSGSPPERRTCASFRLPRRSTSRVPATHRVESAGRAPVSGPPGFVCLWGGHPRPQPAPWRLLVLAESGTGRPGEPGCPA